MKYWVWLIFLSAAGGTAYLVFAPGSSDTPEPKKHHQEATSEKNEEDQEDKPTVTVPKGEATETILPEDAPKKTKTASKKASEGEDDGDAEASDRPADDEGDHLQDDEYRHERDLALAPLPARGMPYSSRKPRTRKSEPADAPAPTASASPSGTASLGTTPAAAPSPSSSSGSSAPVLGGTFPAMPASATASASSGSTSSSGSSSRSTFSPGSASPSSTDASSSRTLTSGENDLPDKLLDPNVTQAKKIAPPPPTNDVLVKPLVMGPPPNEKAATPPDGQNIESPESAWMESMRIPAGFSGLTVSPPSMTAASPNGVPGEPASPLLFATWKSNFEAGDKPTLQIQKDCGDPAANPDCDAHPQNGPDPLDYLSSNGSHPIPEGKEGTFEIGTITLGTQKDALGKDDPQVEAAFHLGPGFLPGKYTAVLFTKDRKLTASFEILPVAAMNVTSGQAPTTQPTTQPTTLPASKSHVPR